MVFGKTLSITEPHPSVSSDRAYFHSGRGGAGNVTRVSKADITAGPDATGPASRVKLPSPPTNHYVLSGRGGAGNMQRGRSEQAIFSFDEELEAQRRLQEHAAPVYHIGRGGNGNFVDETKPSPHRKSSGSSTVSTESAGSGKSAKVRRSMEGAWAGMKRTLSAR